MLSKTRCLTCVGVHKSARHTANPSFHAIIKVSTILGTLTMLKMSINKVRKPSTTIPHRKLCKKTRNDEKCFKNDLCGTVVAYLHKEKDVAHTETTHCMYLMSQHGRYDHALQCEIFKLCRAHYRGFEESQRATQGEKHARQFLMGTRCQQHDDD